MERSGRGAQRRRRTLHQPGLLLLSPADAALKKLVDEGEVVALAYHVDYWNYLGWADTLASKENTERQMPMRACSAANGVYTPQGDP